LYFAKNSGVTLEFLLRKEGIFFFYFILIFNFRKQREVFPAHWAGFLYKKLKA